jgi:hypothetical protein
MLYLSNVKQTFIEMTYQEQAIEIIRNARTAKDIYSKLNWISESYDPNNLGFAIAQMIVENSNDFTKSIAEEWISRYDNSPLHDLSERENINKGNPRAMSDKQTWCMAYQVMNNKNVYTS